MIVIRYQIIYLPKWKFRINNWCNIKFSKTLNSEFKIDSNNAMIGFFSMKTNRTRLRFGETLRTIIADEYSNKMADNLKSYLRSSDYYSAWNRLIDDTDYYFRFLRNRISHPSSDSSDLDILVSVLTIAISIIIVSLIVFCCCACYRFEKNKEFNQTKIF